jgi:2'-5' RNA ligase
MPATCEPTRRLFFALWPDAAVRDALVAVAARPLRRVKRVRPANLHMTLAFPGAVTRAVQDCLEAEAGAIAVPPFELCIDTAGYWPRPRIAWLGPAHAPAEIWALSGALRTALERCGLVPEARPFLPHITLARKVNPGTTIGAFEPVHWPVGHFALVESVTDPAGAVYRPLRSWPLEAPQTSV